MLFFHYVPPVNIYCVSAFTGQAHRAGLQSKYPTGNIVFNEMQRQDMPQIHYSIQQIMFTGNTARNVKNPRRPVSYTHLFTAENLPCGQAEEWSPENPVLYHLTAVLQDGMGNDMDDWIDRVGFREIRMEGKDILLNGRKIRIKGFCRHEDHPQFGCAIPFQAMQQDLMLMKDMGANSVRTSHYPNDELFLDLCDETGFLVWEEDVYKRQLLSCLILLW